MRLVPNQDPDDIIERYKKYVKKLTPKGIQTNVKVWSKGPACVVGTNNKYIKAATEAMHEIFKKDTVFIRSGGSIPIVSIGGLSRSVCFLRSWAGRSSGVPPDLFIKKRCSLPCHPEPPSFGERGTWARRANASRSLRGAKSHVWRASLWANCTRPAPLLPSARSAPTLRSVGMSCAETLAGEAIGGYRLKTPARQIASDSSQEQN